MEVGKTYTVTHERKGAFMQKLIIALLAAVCIQAHAQSWQNDYSKTHVDENGFVHGVAQNMHSGRRVYIAISGCMKGFGLISLISDNDRSKVLGWDKETPSGQRLTALEFCANAWERGLLK